MTTDAIIYNNIEKDFQSINGWRDSALFPFAASTEVQKQKLVDFCVFEVIFESNNRNKKDFDSAFDNLEKYVRSLIQRMSMPAYRFISEFRTQPPNRLRSHKGIFSKTEKSRYIQNELATDNNNTIISGLAVVDIGNDIITNITDSSCRFMILTNKDFLSYDTLKRVTMSCMKHGVFSTLNYIQLIEDFCNDDDIIIRMAGDGGVNYVSVQFFFKKASKDLILEKAGLDKKDITEV